MSYPGTPWRERAREQFETLLDTIDAEWTTERESAARDAAERARSQFSESLNQGLRRIRETKTLEDAAIVAVEITAPFAARCAVFAFADDRATALAARGLGSLPLSFSPADSAAFRTCVDTQDPVIAIAAASEISPELAARVEIDNQTSDQADRVFLLPLRVRQEVRAILFAAGAVQPAQMELVAGIAAIQMESVTPPPILKRADLFAIGGVSAPPHSASPRSAPPGEQSWNDLSPDLQRLHLRAQREARLRTAQIRLEHGDALRRGLERSDIYDALRGPIDDARAAFQKDYVAASPTMVDYLYLELVRGLARDEDRLLGPHFPGPLV